MAQRDLRTWIKMLEDEGDLKRVTAEVDWNRELGAITRRVFSEGGPALLFENIKDYKQGRCTKLFTGGLARIDRMARMLDLPRETHPGVTLKTVMERYKKPIPAVRVSTGPVKENILKGDEVDLAEFPAPLWHHWDGGRYINTFAGVVSRDPDTGVQNVGIYRGMIGKKNTIPTQLWPAQHWGHHWLKYADKGEPMPVACVIGWGPVLAYAGSSPIPLGLSEYDVMGGLAQEPVELVQCETVDLEVPATAEIVIEGTISPHPSDFEIEGPFGEFTGYYGGARMPRHSIHVTCITHRNDPIFRGTLEGTLPGQHNENSTMCSIQRAALAWNVLNTAGVPHVTDVWVHPVSNGTNIVVQIHKIYRGHAKQVSAALWGSNAAHLRYKHVMVVDEDIDIHSYEALDWAFAYRVNAGEDDIVIYPDNFGSALDPSTRLDQRDTHLYGTGKWNRMLIDATVNWNFEKQERWGNKRYPPTCDVAPEDKELVAKRWKEYGF